MRRNNFEVMDNASIKENIFRIRTEKGLSQDEMARKLGVVRNTYRKIEKGAETPSPPPLRAADRDGIPSG